MPLIPIVEVDTFSASVTVPQPGDLDTTASLVASVQALSNRTRNLVKRAYFSDANGTVNRLVIPIGGPADRDAGGQDWTFHNPNWWQVANVPVFETGLVWAIQPPMNGRVDSVTVRLGGNILGTDATPHAALPAVMPVIRLFSGLDGLATLIASATDTAAPAAAYDIPHSVTISGLNYQVVINEELFLVVEGESGANSVANSLAVGGAFMTIIPA